MLRSAAAIYFMQGAVGAKLPLSYTYFWLWSEPFWLVLLVAVALEVHSKIWKERASVLRQTRPILIAALVIALVFAALPLRFETAHGAFSGLITMMHVEIRATQYISSVLSIFLLLSAALFVVLAGPGLKSNLFRHEGMLAAYLGIYALAAFLIDIGAARAVFINGYVSSALTLCFIVWISAFRPQEIPN
ncbi:MAG TPA: hypothetical protein VME17_00380 [Bryobacteraceae bacterium]|nr:hypothetical protein [Bryobacteraceae bacterium]